MIWFAYLSEDLSANELKALAVRAAFVWDASFGDIPVELSPLLTELGPGD